MVNRWRRWTPSSVSVETYWTTVALHGTGWSNCITLHDNWQFASNIASFLFSTHYNALTLGSALQFVAGLLGGGKLLSCLPAVGGKQSGQLSTSTRPFSECFFPMNSLKSGIILGKSCSKLKNKLLEFHDCCQFGGYIHSALVLRRVSFFADTTERRTAKVAIVFIVTLMLAKFECVSSRMRSM